MTSSRKSTGRRKPAADKAHDEAGLRLLKEEILGDLQDQFPLFKIPQLFIVWFLEAKYGIEVNKGKELVTDGPHDKGVDAVYIDDQNQKAYIIQSKYSDRTSSSQNKEELFHTASIARILCDGDDDYFDGWLKSARRHVQDAVRTAYDRIWLRNYKLEMIFVTCHTVSDSLVKDVRREFRKIRDARISVVSRTEVLHLAEQYFDGEVPAIEKITIKAADAGSIIFHEGNAGSLSSYICKCQCKGFVKQIKNSKIPLEFFFHRNIRGFLGESRPVNADIANTIRNEPQLFFYLNNGITILTTGVTKSGASLELLQPQIINGQQTTNVLASHEKSLSASANVLVRVIVLNRVHEYENVRKLVRKMVKATNWQTAITKADLRSNDPEQIRLQRHMDRRGCLYIRKSGPASQFRHHGRKYRATITKERLAQAIGACMFDQRVIRSGKDHLFGADNYPKIFSMKRHVDWYLARYFTERAVNAAKNHVYRKPAWSYAKWMVVNFVWGSIAPVVSPGGRVTSTTSRFVDTLTYDKRNPNIKLTMERLAVATYRAATIFYEQQAAGKDESLFFRDQSNLNRQFGEFMKQRNNSRRRKKTRKWIDDLGDELAKELE